MTLVAAVRRTSRSRHQTDTNMDNDVLLHTDEQQWTPGATFESWVHPNKVLKSTEASESANDDLEGLMQDGLLHPDSLKPFRRVLHPDNLEEFHPICNDSLVLLTKSGRNSLSKEGLLKLQRIWQCLDKIALSSPRPNDTSWKNAIDRYRPSSST